MGAWRLIELPRVQDHRGSLTFVEGGRHVPFEIARVYYLYDVPRGAERAGHAHKQLQQVLIAVSGSFDVHLDDGRVKETIALRRADVGLRVGEMVWARVDNFSPGAVCLVLASQPYSEEDYYRDYGDFIAAERSQ